MNGKLRELENQLEKELKERFGGMYTVFESCIQGNKKLYGEHITVYLPTEVAVNVAKITELFERFYAPIVKTIYKKTPVVLCDKKYKEVILILESD